MYWQVYFHQNARSYEVVLEKIFQRFKDLVEQNYNFKTDVRKIKAIMNPNFTVEDYLRLDDIVVTAIIIDLQEEDDLILADLAYRFINRKIFKDVQWSNCEDFNKRYDEVAQYLRENGIDPKYYLSMDKMTQYIYKNMNTDVEKIKLICNDGQLRSIEDVSSVLSGLTKIKNKVDYRIYFPEDLVIEKTGKSLKL